jgi:ubiquinone/menaquinone biosynthesis C-methylase UbiE
MPRTNAANEEGYNQSLRMRPLPPLAVRIASHLPLLKGLHARISAERQLWTEQRRVLERERDELLGHCRRLNEELDASRAREEVLRTECDWLRDARYALSNERDQILEYLDKLDLALPESARRELTPAQYLLQKMRLDWDDRARINATYYTNSANVAWDDESYFASGEQNIREQILNDLPNICQGADPKQMRILEIGCGAGRMTRALCRVFGEVHAVDISAEMIARARQNLSAVNNVSFYQNNGMDLQVVPALGFDFVFSYIVFQHIPSKEVIENYIREAGRLLKPGRLFKFQVQGVRPTGQRPQDTWLGADFTSEEIASLAARCGFEARHQTGAGTQYLWLWFFRRNEPQA